MKLWTGVKQFSVLLLLAATFSAQAGEYFSRTNKYEFGHDIFEPDQVTFIVRDTGKRIGDLAGLCKSLVLIDIKAGTEKVLDDCVGGSDYKLNELKEYYLRALAQAKAEGHKVLIDMHARLGYDTYHLKIFTSERD